jgi:hypothetical protein
MEHTSDVDGSILRGIGLDYIIASSLLCLSSVQSAAFSSFSSFSSSSL